MSVDECFVVGGTGDTDEALLTPAGAPTVSNFPIVLAVANSLHSMVKICGILFAAPGEDASSVRTPQGCIKRNGNRTYRESSLKCMCYIRFDFGVACGLDRRFVCRASA